MITAIILSGMLVTALVIAIKDEEREAKKNEKGRDKRIHH